MHDHSGLGQLLDRAIELVLCSGSDRLGRFCHGPLERIIERGFRIRIEALRPNHDHSVGTLFVHFVPAAGAKTLRENRRPDNRRCAFDHFSPDLVATVPPGFATAWAALSVRRR